MRRYIAIICIIALILVANSNILAAANNKQIPTVISSNFKADGINEAVNKIITIKFSSMMQKGVGFSKISLTDSKKKLIAINASFNKNTLTISHKANLMYSSDYTLTIPKNAAKSINGSLFTKVLVFKFRTMNKLIPTPTPALKSTPIPTQTPTPSPTPTPATPIPETTFSPIPVASKNELHAFYPAYIPYNSDMEQFINKLNYISFAWARLDFNAGTVINTSKGTNGNYGFYIPEDSVSILKFVKSKGISAHISIFSQGSDLQKILPYKDLRDDAINKIINLLAEGIDIGEGEKFYYDGVVMDFEDLHDTSPSGSKILFDGEVISTYYNLFLKDLKARLISINKRLIVALQPITYNDGYEYNYIITLADKVIIMAHDYAPRVNVLKSEIMKYINYDTKQQSINSLAPITEVSKTLDYVKSKINNTSDLSKVWVQISFDSRQWRFKVQSSSDWNTLDDSTLSSECATPKYSALSKCLENTDSAITDVKYRYINGLGSPYITLYNTQKGLFDFILYEDSNSVKAKIEKAQSFEIGGVSIWALGNIPNYEGICATDYHLDTWQQILKLLGK